MPEKMPLKDLSRGLSDPADEGVISASWKNLPRSIVGRGLGARPSPFAAHSLFVNKVLRPRNPIAQKLFASEQKHLRKPKVLPNAQVIESAMHWGN